jgi:signal transduction histidine kinase
MSPGTERSEVGRAVVPGSFRHRLFHRIFLTMLGFVVAAIGLSALAGHLLLSEVFRTGVADHLTGRARSMIGELAPATATPAVQQAVLERLADERRVAAALWSADGRRLAFTTADLPSPVPGASSTYWLPSRSGPVLAIPLPDSRTLVMQPHRVPRPVGFLLSVIALAAVLALASFPVARRITRRLETLEAGVWRLGEGDLEARVDVDGDDELASLGKSFNHTASRLQRLVEAQRRVLASASHELRSPLARLRMALELSRDNPADSQPRLDAAVAEVEELDSLVEELLLAGRLEVQEGIPAAEPVDLGALLSEEAARIRITVETRPVTVPGDRRLLRVLVRNLLENAGRHAGGTVETGVEPGPAGARLWVADRGPGIPDSERERIFEPFYRPASHAEGRDGGVGLGLYLVRRIAERHGGTAACRPRDGGGTVFEVALPLPASRPAASPGAAPTVVSHGITPRVD